MAHAVLVNENSVVILRPCELIVEVVFTPPTMAAPRAVYNANANVYGFPFAFAAAIRTNLFSHIYSPSALRMAARARAFFTREDFSALARASCVVMR